LEAGDVFFFFLPWWWWFFFKPGISGRGFTDYGLVEKVSGSCNGGIGQQSCY
jgi:hypothetical protein